MRLINLTPHQINIYGNDKGTPELLATVPPSGKVCRVKVTRERCNTLVGDLPVFRTVISNEIEGLPEEMERADCFIVSALCLQAIQQSPQFPGRIQFYSPGEGIRDEQGQVIGCLGLSQ